MDWTKSLEVELATGERELPEDPEQKEIDQMEDERCAEEFEQNEEDCKHKYDDFV